MKANKKFYEFTFLLNLVLAAIGFFILWGIRALTKEALASFIVCGIIFLAIALFVNIFIVRRSKLKTPYFLFGTIVNVIIVSGLTALTILL